jgi:rare lipoprotein A
VSGVGPALAAARLCWRTATALPARLLVSLILIAGVGASVVACRSGNGEQLGERVIPLGQPVPKGGGVYRTGSAYQVDGVWYQPREDPAYDRVGTASWYGELFHGRRTANGEIYDMDRLSAASTTLPMPVYARVTNLANRRSIIVRVNDRGPYANDRIMDVSRRSAELLGFRDSGTARVRVQYLARAPLSGDDSYERRYLASQGWAAMASGGKPRPAASDPLAVASIAREAPSSPQRKNGAAVPSSTASIASVPDRAAGPPSPQLLWQASAQAPGGPSVASGEDLPRAREASGSKPGGLLIQAGSFKSADNAEKARRLLADIADVEVAPMQQGADTLFRVRLGPFIDRGEAASALARVTGAGYAGAKIVAN